MFRIHPCLHQKSLNKILANPEHYSSSLSRDEVVARDTSERALRLARRHARQQQRKDKGKGVDRSGRN
jgi:hypothetical protein